VYYKCTVRLKCTVPEETAVAHKCAAMQCTVLSKERR
jgi:hypothetical protein